MMLANGTKVRRGLAAIVVAVCAALAAAGALASARLGDTSVAFDVRELSGAERQRGHHDDLTFTQIDFPGAVSTAAIGINHRGRVVGTFEDGAGMVHGYLLDGGIFSRIDVPGATRTTPQGINDRGQIAIVFRDARDAQHSSLLDRGAFTEIDVPGALVTVIHAINDHGQIVGIFQDAGGVFHGFLFDHGAFTQIDFPGATVTNAYGINDRGQIVGDFADGGGVAHGFLATKEQFSGKAIGLGPGEDNAGVEIVGTGASPTDLDLSAATRTITSLLDEQAGGGELVPGLPLVLTAVPGSRRDLALFQDPSRPNSTSVTILDAGPGAFIFRIKVNDVTIRSPQQCSPARLTTSFRVDVARTPPVVVSTERSWICFGPSNTFLKTH